jgi:hypothetical protein
MRHHGITEKSAITDDAKAIVRCRSQVLTRRRRKNLLDGELERLPKPDSAQTANTRAGAWFRVMLRVTVSRRASSTEQLRRLNDEHDAALDEIVVNWVSHDEV